MLLGATTGIILSDGSLGRLGAHWEREKKTSSSELMEAHPFGCWDKEEEETGEEEKEDEEEEQPTIY